MVHLQGDLRTQAGLQRSEGVHRALDRFPAISLACEAAGDWTLETGVKLMHLALAAHPEVQAVVAGNDMTALEAADAVAEAACREALCVVRTLSCDLLVGLYSVALLPDQVVKIHKLRKSALKRAL